MIMRYWKIAPGDGGSLWVEQKEHDCIAIGWNETGDLNLLKDKEAIKRRFDSIGWRGSTSRQLLMFYNKINADDKIVASSGEWIYGVGTIAGEYGFNQELYYMHSRPVRWERAFWDPVSVDGLGVSDGLRKRLHLNTTILELASDEWKELEKAVWKVNSPFAKLNDFQGLSRAPQTEQELVMLFSKMNQHLKMKIESVGRERIGSPSLPNSN